MGITETIKNTCDFSGWVTKNNLRCSDGRVIRHNAFAVNDGDYVPMVWNHQHSDIRHVLGKVFLENRDDGVYGYGFFNNSANGQDAKEAVRHGDVKSMSIWANNLNQVGSDILHGVIREVSLVLAGANPGAFIESVMAHGEPMEDGDEECILHTGEDLYITHAIEETKVEKEKKKETTEDPVKAADSSDEEKTVKEVIDTLNEEQKKAVAIIIGQVVADAKGGNSSKDKEENNMGHNAFEGNDNKTYLSHAELKNAQKEFLMQAKSVGSLREAIRQYKEDVGDEGMELFHSVSSVPTAGMVTSTGNQNYGFNDPAMLFPEYRLLNNQPEWISRNMDWVTKFFQKVHRTPFSRIKSVYANITEDEARARGYIKGKLKKDEVFSLLKRTTDPETIYKKQKLDRDDIVDITDFDIVAWIRAEMRVMLNEEIARACLIGDGRMSSDDDKIPEDHIRPIVKEPGLFNTIVKVTVPEGASQDVIAKETIKAIVRFRKKYKGTGRPDFWTTDDVVTEMLLLENTIGDTIYKTEQDLATKLRVGEIIPVEPMTDQVVSMDGKDYPLIGIVVNVGDYNIGTNKGGEINNFDDFDIDYNQYKYLIETRLSGALIKPFSALTVVLDQPSSRTNSAKYAGSIEE